MPRIPRLLYLVVSILFAGDLGNTRPSATIGQKWSAIHDFRWDAGRYHQNNWS